MRGYSDAVLHHFHSPHRVGEVEPPRRLARRENPVCGDVAEFSVRVQGGRLDQVRFRAFGCVAAIASCSCLAGLVEGRSPEEALSVGVEELLEQLGGLPSSKTHGAQLAVQAFRAALEGFETPVKTS
ncbi:MAG: iron-sulfur cluster assembly scaffold protein [Candidatus Eremiobacterota bacterium]